MTTESDLTAQGRSKRIRAYQKIARKYRQLGELHMVEIALQYAENWKDKP